MARGGGTTPISLKSILKFKFIDHLFQSDVCGICVKLSWAIEAVEGAGINQFLDAAHLGLVNPHRYPIIGSHVFACAYVTIEGL